MHICVDTGYSSVQIPHNSDIKNYKKNLNNKLIAYKPAYFERFKYVGKGFKLIFKKKKKYSIVFLDIRIFIGLGYSNQL